MYNICEYNLINIINEQFYVTFLNLYVNQYALYYKIY